LEAEAEAFLGWVRGAREGDVAVQRLGGGERLVFPVDLVAHRLGAEAEI
jgi:hypothetical protein